MRSNQLAMNPNFEHAIFELTQPINGQYPRPWVTDLTDPRKANTFIVGKNQRNGFRVEDVGSHQRHVDALFNRNGEECRKLYDQITGNKPSPTRKNSDCLVSELNAVDVFSILETNVICYSTPMSADLRLNSHIGGTSRGEEIFRFLLTQIKPSVLIVHGAGAVKNLEKVLKCELGPLPSHEDDLRLNECDGMLVVAIPSLAPPAYNKWIGWAPAHLKRVAAAVAKYLAVSK